MCRGNSHHLLKDFFGICLCSILISPLHVSNLLQNGHFPIFSLFRRPFLLLGPVKVYITCADKGILSGGGGPDPTARKQPYQLLFVCLFVLCSPQPINRGVPMVLFQRGLSLFRGSIFFQGGGSKC